jgi:arylsulfatase A-like enzyme
LCGRSPVGILVVVNPCRRRATLLLAWLGASLGAAGCGLAPQAETAGPGVLLIVVDGLRADHLSASGYDRITTPALDLLAADGVRFTSAFAAAPLAIPSHASLLTGSDPVLSRRFAPGELDGREERNWRIPAALPRLAAEFLSAGRRTAAFVDDAALAPFFGFDTGFQDYDLASDASHESPASSESPTSSGRARGRCLRFLRWVQTLERGEPWFALLHFSDLERCWAEPDPIWDGYFPPRAHLSEVPPVGITDTVLFSVPRSRWRGGSRTLGEYEASYDGHLCKLDLELGELFAGLRRLSRYDETTVSVVGSFGVQFGEAGLYLSSGGYSVADLHVPWILRLRHGAGVEGARGRTIDDVASTMDVAPTLLAAEGIPPPRGMLGRSLLPRLEGRGTARSAVFSSCGLQEGGAVFGADACLEVLFPGELADDGLRRSWFGEEVARAPAAAVRFYRWKEEPFPPLDEVGSDPKGDAFRAMWQARSERTERLRKAQHLLQRTPGSETRVSEAERRELAALGYLGKGR